jgi:hypothetical protein
MALKLRRGTDAERLTIVPLQGELIFTTNTKKLYVGDGAAQGGILVGPVDGSAFDLVNDTTPQLGGNLDLNGNNITGIGNINIDGTITATGNIGLGDADSDQITVSGLISSSLRPALDNTYNLGTQARRWQNVHATGAFISGQVDADSLLIRGNIESGDSTVIYEASTGLLTVNSIRASTIEGDLTGSVFSDDSGAVLVDSVAGQITGPINNSIVTTNEISIPGPLGGIKIVTEGTRDDNYSLFNIESYHDSSGSSSMFFIHGRGDTATPQNIVAGDTIIDMLFMGQTGTGPAPSVVLNASSDTQGTITDGVAPGQFIIAIQNDAGTVNPVFALNKDGKLSLAGNTLTAGVGSGQVDDTSVATYLEINVGGTVYGIPLYAVNP